MTLDQNEAGRRNSAFYSRFRYPWRPNLFSVPSDPGHATRFLNQAIGAWRGERLPCDMRIWVAGCGTNQAVLLALNFPKARIVATDVSPGSLESSRQLAEELGVRNVRFERQPIEAMDERGTFDFILCTGVIHHNPDPAGLLRALAGALRREGILELMVYNSFHRTEAAAFQDAIRTIAADAVATGDLELQLELAHGLVAECPSGPMRDALAVLRNAPEEMIADALLQPVELSFTVPALAELLAEAGLRLALPCPNQFDEAERRPGWDIRFDNAELSRRYWSLPDVERWRIAADLLLGRSPMLWFYIDRIDSSAPLPGIKQVCNSFLRERFERSTVPATVFTADEAGRLLPASRPITLPGTFPPADARFRATLDAIDSLTPIGNLLDELEIRDLAEINLMREKLTTPVSPYLRAVGS